MGRAPCCDKTKVKKGPWSPEEDVTLKNYLEKYGTGGNWIALPSKAGLNRCGKSCRLRWLNYLRPDIRHGGFTDEEDNTICELYTKLGSRWSVIASQLVGRTDNDVKNHWNTKLRKKLLAAKNHHTTTTNHHRRLANNPIPPPALVPKPESYNLRFSALLTQNSPTMPEFPNTNYLLDFNNQKMVYDPIHYSLPPQVPQLSNHNISSSSEEASSFSWSGNGVFGGFSMESGYELNNGGWSHETGSEFGNYYASLVNSVYSDIKPQGLLQSVTNQY